MDGDIKAAPRRVCRESRGSVKYDIRGSFVAYVYHVIRICRVTSNVDSQPAERPGEAPARLDPETAALLAFVNDADGPVGARQILASLTSAGFAMSESTTARRLRELDARGFTRQVGTKGRVITAIGAEMVARSRRATSARLVAATEVRTAEDLLNVLRARRAIEPEAVRDAAQHVSAKDIQDLWALLDAHRSGIAGQQPIQPIVSMEFHRRLAEPAMNPIVRAVHRLVLDSNLQHVDSALDLILKDEGQSSSVDAHAAILQAVERGDGVHAAALMYDHIETLISETQEFIAANGPALVGRLLLGVRVREPAFGGPDPEYR